MSIETRVVGFGGDTGEGSSGVQLFADAARNINAYGTAKTSFYPGETKYYLLIIPDGYRLAGSDPVRVTNGTVTSFGEVSRETTDRLLFAGRGVPEQLSQIPVGDVEPTWYGKRPVLSIDGQSASVDEAVVVADLTYRYSALSYGITCPPDVYISDDDGADYPIGLVVFVEAIQ